MCELHTQLSLSPASSPVSPQLGQPSFGAGSLPERVLPPSANSTEAADAARGFTPLQEYRRLERGFRRELDIFLLAFCSLGVRTRRFGTTGRGRKAALS